MSGSEARAALNSADMELLESARRQFAARRDQAEKSAHRWMQTLEWPSLPADLSLRLSNLAFTCRILGDLDSAALLEAVAASHPVASDQTARGELEFIGGEGRLAEVWRCDSLFPVIRENLIEERRLDNHYCSLRVPLHCSLLVRVSTFPGEPSVEVPVELGATTQFTLDLRALQPMFAPVALRFIPPTTCEVGGDLLARSSLPSTPVRLSALAVQEAPLTIREFAELGGDVTNCQFLGQRVFDDNLRPNSDVFASRQAVPGLLPAVGLNLFEVQEFIQRLPPLGVGRWDLLDSLEWEALFRGPERLVFPWGNEWVPSAANVLDETPAALEAVQTRPLDRSRWGLFDGAGNAEEWTVTGADIIAKGGSWYNDKQISRCASRVVRAHDYRHPKLGFRLAVRL